MTEDSTTPDLERRSRQLIEAANRRDFDAMLAFYSPDAVWELDPGGIGLVEGSSLVGREAIRKFAEDVTGAFANFETQIEEFHYLGSGVAFAVYVQRGRPQGGNGFVEVRDAAVAIWTDGRIGRITTHSDIDEGRAAAERLAEERG